MYLHRTTTYVPPVHQSSIIQSEPCFLVVSRSARLNSSRGSKAESGSLSLAIGSRLTARNTEPPSLPFPYLPFPSLSLPSLDPTRGQTYGEAVKRCGRRERASGQTQPSPFYVRRSRGPFPRPFLARPFPLSFFTQVSSLGTLLGLLVRASSRISCHVDVDVDWSHRHFDFLPFSTVTLT
ncbi:hypothetical protein LY76DRAFT_416954 [Colletotrichum caudatum]|nr:hypothetical protein LY76DRAFT_416954 [Colletotrichum caudatum]